MAEEKTDFDALKQRCFLDGYVTGRKETKKLGDSEYQITFFQGDHSTEYMVAEMKDVAIKGQTVTIRGRLKESDVPALEALADAIIGS